MTSFNEKLLNTLSNGKNSFILSNAFDLNDYTPMRLFSSHKKIYGSNVVLDPDYSYNQALISLPLKVQGIIRADNVSFDNESRLAALETRISQLETRLSQLE